MEIYRLAELKKYHVIIPYTESGNSKKLFTIQYKIDAGSRYSAISSAEAEFDAYSTSSSASWTRFIVRSKIRAWRIIEGFPQTSVKIDQLISDFHIELAEEKIIETMKMMGALEDASTSSAIIRFFSHTNPEIISAAIEALGKIGDPGDFAPVVREYDVYADPKIKASVLIAASKLALPDDDILPIILSALDDDDGRVRANAIEALGNTPKIASEQYIVPMLKDQSNRVRANAIVALWPKYNHAELLDILKEMISKDEKEAKLSAIYVLSQTQIPGRLELLYSLTQHDKCPEVSNTAKESLFSVNEINCIPYWIKLINTEDDFSAIVTKIVKLGEVAISPLLSYQSEKDEEIKNAARLLDQLEQQTLRNKSWMDWLKTKQKRLFHQQSKPRS